MTTFWSEIHTDLLYSILSKLSVPDLLRCAAVCSHWSAVVDEVRRRPLDQCPQIPWLLPERRSRINGEYNCQNTYNFFSLSEGREYDISRIPGTVAGSSHGWLVIERRVRVKLLNPITGVQIDLPSIPTFEDDRNLEAVKATLSSDPCRGGDYRVACVFFSHSKRENFLFFVKAGDEKWTMIPGGQYYYDDIVFYKGKLYAVSTVSPFEEVDVSSTKHKFHAVSQSEEDDAVMVATYNLIPSDLTPTEMPAVDILSFTYDMHFFCTPSGDLLIAQITTKTIQVSDPDHHIKEFKVWKFDTDNGGMVAVNNLGRYALFLCQVCSFCLDTSSLPEFKSNSIYISNQYCENLVYSMDDKSFTSLSLPSVTAPKKWRPVLVWFIPSPVHVDHPMET